MPKENIRDDPRKQNTFPQKNTVLKRFPPQFAFSLPFGPMGSSGHVVLWSCGPSHLLITVDLPITVKATVTSIRNTFDNSPW